jgi:hypothetical protein
VEPARAGPMPGAEDEAAARRGGGDGGETESERGRQRRARAEDERHGGGRPAGEGTVGGELRGRSEPGNVKFVWNGLSRAPAAAEWSALRDQMGSSSRGYLMPGAGRCARPRRHRRSAGIGQRARERAVKARRHRLIRRLNFLFYQKSCRD